MQTKGQPLRTTNGTIKRVLVRTLPFAFWNLSISERGLFSLMQGLPMYMHYKCGVGRQECIGT